MKAGKEWHIDDKNAIAACPYGQPGGQLWVREPYTIIPRTAYWHDPTIAHRERDEQWAVYQAGWNRVSPGWRSPATMPRWASRLTLEVTAVKIQRPNDATVQDAQAEGFDGIFQLLSHYAKKEQQLWAAMWVVSFKRVEADQ